MQVDQAALTGESLPVNISPGEKLKMGSAIKRGEVSWRADTHTRTPLFDPILCSF